MITKTLFIGDKHTINSWKICTIIAINNITWTSLLIYQKTFHNATSVCMWFWLWNWPLNIQGIDPPRYSNCYLFKKILSRNFNTFYRTNHFSKLSPKYQFLKAVSKIIFIGTVSKKCTIWLNLVIAETEHFTTILQPNRKNHHNLLFWRTQGLTSWSLSP